MLSGDAVDHADSPRLVPENQVRSLVSAADALETVEAVFAAMDRGEAVNFPVTRNSIDSLGAVFGVKSGYDRSRGVLGLKAGGYWKNNQERNLGNHQSTVVLFDDRTGRISAVAGANYLTALRTAAAAACSVRHLARPDVRVLGIVGAGGQAPWQLRAVAAVRQFEGIVAWNRSSGKAEALKAVADELGLDFRLANSANEVASEADVLISITSSAQPLIADAALREGVHICAMGTDTRGKQELDPQIFGRASVFTDEVEQAIAIGECQHAFASGAIGHDQIRPLGGVINGRLDGRMTDREITLFDGTGVALQDLAVAALVMERAR